MGRDIDDFLNQARESGDQLDEGAITIDPEKALEKFAQFALPELGLWVLKLVQAAVASGAPEIRFKFLRGRVEAWFPNTASWEAEAVLSNIVMGATPNERGLAHLQAGILGASGDGNISVTWSCGKHQLTYTGGSFEKDLNTRQSSVMVVAVRKKGRASLSQSFNLPFRQVLKQTAFEYKALIERTRSCPIPIWADGLELTGTYRRSYSELPKIKNFKENAWEGLTKLLAVCPIQNLEKRPALTYPLRNKGELEVEQTNETPKFDYVAVEAEPGPVQGVLSVFSCWQRLHELVYLHDGVMLQSFPIQSHYPNSFFNCMGSVLWVEYMCFSIHLEARPENIDLSHFQVRTEPLTDVFHALPVAFYRSLEEATKYLHLPWETRASWLPSAGAKDSSVADAALWSFLGPTLLGIGVVFAGVAVPVWAVGSVLRKVGIFKSIEGTEAPPAETYPKLRDQIATVQNALRTNYPDQIPPRDCWPASAPPDAD